ncbi:hypothetical protein [Paraburkholderia saeva]|uniref:Uncharacterized protein n=1 Tax=Paraburkholderia saeva TaxID=2777537 RepID=A0A9N8RUG3_9BURK|nr:hypothetical protein [Paraburkholderia saeva]CAG4886943.1 hypothetical protein R52603_00291 [Paraburkholderia saeva]CAG4894417.1 hypothetical protein LMG31841_01910 [Paraburkholderia saeva]CAG4898924.1 hypothetical protein R70241_02546 [Paraburkholderia saeva]
MFDAEIAATLLNRWDRKPAMAGRDTYLNLLREGNLDFTHQQGRVSTGNPTSDSELDIESLVFVDGSRAVRIKASGQAPGWTRWAALEPPSVLVPDFA